MYSYIGNDALQQVQTNQQILMQLTLKMLLTNAAEKFFLSVFRENKT